MAKIPAGDFLQLEKDNITVKISKFKKNNLAYKINDYH